MHYSGLHRDLRAEFGQDPLRNGDLLQDKQANLCFFLSLKVTLVGIITEVNKSATSVTYSVDDTTAAPIKIKHWFEKPRQYFGGEIKL